MTTRLERGIRIIDLLQHGPPKTAAQIANQMKVSRRTIFRDIALLREMGIPIEMDSETSAYFCDTVEESLTSRLLRDADKGKVQQWMLRMLEEAIVNRQTVVIRERDSQQHWVARRVTPLELTFDHRGWRLLFSESSTNADDHVPTSPAFSVSHRPTDTRHVSTRRVSLHQIQVQPN